MFTWLLKLIIIIENLSLKIDSKKLERLKNHLAASSNEEAVIEGFYKVFVRKY